MKQTLLLLLACLLLGIGVQAQQIPQNPNLTDSEGKRQGKWTILYDANWTIITDAAKAEFYRLIEYKDDKPTGTVTDHYRNGTVQMEATLLADRPEDIMDGTVIFYDAQGKKEKEALYKNGQLVSEESFPDPESWKALNQTGTQAYYAGDYEKAIEIFEKAKVQAEKEFGTSHEKYAETCNGLANSYLIQGNYTQAELLFVESKEIFAKVLGKEHPNYATACLNLATLYNNQSKQAQAETLYIEAKEIFLKVLGKKDTGYAGSCNGLAGLYDNQGRYAQAEPLYIEAKQIWEEVLGKENPYYATSITNLAYLYSNQGRYTQAELLHIEAKQIWEKVLGKEHPYYATSITNFATLYSNQGKYTQAETLYIEAKEIFARVLGREHPSYATSCSNLAVLYQNQGNYNQAELLYLEAKEVQGKILGEEHPEYARSCNNLAVLYTKQGKYAKAEPLYQKASEIYKIVLGENHPDYATSLNNFAALYADKGDYNSAEPLYKEASQILIAQTETNFSNLSEKEKGLFLATFKDYFEIYHSFALKAQKPELAGWLYDNTLAVKGLLFQSSQKIRERVMASNDEALKSLFKDWQSQREYLSAIYQLSTTEKERRQINQAQEEAKANALEKQLSAQSEFFATALDNQQVTWQEVQQQLKKEEAVIEINRIRYYDNKAFTDSVLYVALILKPESKQPEMLVLENGNELEGKYTRYYKNMTLSKQEDQYSYAQFWEKIAQKLAGIQKVYLATDGAYHQINLQTLKNPSTGKYLYEELDLHIIGSSKDLVRKKASASAIQQVALVGYPAFNESIKETEKIASEQANLALTRGDSSMRFFNGEDISMLPGTKVEIEILEKTLKKAKITSTSYLGMQASEKTVKALDSPSILHIATHGFFLPNADLGDVGEDKLLGLDKNKVFENPLLRSGLLFASAKNALSEGGEGVLTAYEAMNLNLDNTSLVVLSACETGLGELSNGEGVYGLQRSFQQAGARSVIMSLWKVDDAVTQKLMTTFYENWLIKKQSKRAAFKNAQATIQAEYKYPYYWGAFVMVGE